MCRSWRDKVSTNTPLWRVLCWQRGGRIESRDGVPPDYFFRSFLGLRRVIHLMACGSAFTRERPAFVNTVMVNRRELACSQIAYSNHTIAIGQSDCLQQPHHCHRSVRLLTATTPLPSVSQIAYSNHTSAIGQSGCLQQPHQCHRSVRLLIATTPVP